MHVIVKQLDFRHFACVLFEVADQFTATHLPDANLTFHTSGAYELVVRSEAHCCDSTLMGILNLPKKRTVVDSVGANKAVRPT